VSPRRYEGGALPGIAQQHKSRADSILPKEMGTKYEDPLVDVSMLIGHVWSSWYLKRKKNKDRYMVLWPYSIFLVDAVDGGCGYI
jgi:hypothetical protein